MLIPPAVQEALAQRSLYLARADGVMGPLTCRGLMSAAAGRKSLLEVDWEQAKAFWQACVDAEIDTRLRLLHAIAQACVETAYFTVMVERGSSAYFARYDGRMGNKAGEGFCYRGRGFPMLTGHDNYDEAGKALGVDLLMHPDLAAQPDVSGDIFAHYWRTRHINAHADADDLRGVTKLVNGGLNGLEDRFTVLNRLKALWPATAAAAA